MTKPINPFSLNGRPIGKGPGVPPETAEDILRQLRRKAAVPSRPVPVRPLRPARASAAANGGTTPSPAMAQAAASSSAAVASGRQRAGGAGQHPADAGGGPDAADMDSLLMEGGVDSGGGTHLPVLAAVFLVSAIAGGTLAGMIFSSRLAPETAEDGMAAPAVTLARKDPASQTAAGRSNETVVRPAGSAAHLITSPGTGARGPAESTTASRASAAHAAVAKSGQSPAGEALKARKVRKDESRIPAMSTPATASVPARNKTAARARTDGAGTQAARPKGAQVAAAAPAAPAAPSSASALAGKDSAASVSSTTGAKADDKDGRAPAVKPLPASTTVQEAEPASVPGQNADDLKALTDNVVAALAGLNQAGEAATEVETGNVREALSALVERALSEGRSEDEVARLLEQALQASGEEAVPAALRDASGKVDLRLLLASIVPAEAARHAAGAEQDYVNQLLEEGERTVVIGGGSPEGAGGRFYMRNGQRYTRIRPGDTLSSIAYEAYGDVLAYPAILRANAGRISVRRLQPGTEIIVPLKRQGARRTEGPVRLAPRTTPKARAATRRKATRARKRATRAARAASRGRKAQKKARAAQSPQPAAQTTETPRKFINFRSRFTGGAIAEPPER
jgi:phage tail protein X